MPIRDYGEEYTDRELRKLEKRLRKVYTESGQEIREKTADFWMRHRVKSEMYLKMVAEGKMDIKDYQAWLRGQVFQGEQWRVKRDQISEIMYHSNEVAQRMINGETVNIFTFNQNYLKYSIENEVGADLGFQVMDSASVTRLLRDDAHILPNKKLVKGRDMRWNWKNIKNELAKGIIQGESIDKLTTRLTKAVPNRNWKQMRVHARTSFTSAMNGGRLEGMREARDNGIEIKKQWLSTLDERTRWMHQDLDLQEVGIDEPFVVGEYSIMYPADPYAEPAMTYNCRCRLHRTIGKYPDSLVRRDNINGQDVGDMSYNEWAAAKGMAQRRPQGMIPVSRR